MYAVLCQTDTAWEDPLTSHRRIAALLDSEPIAAGSLIVLPEMASTGFSMNTRATAEPPGGPTESFYSALAKIYQSCILGGVVTEWQGAPRNQAIAVAPGGQVIARYTKQHPFSPAGESEVYPAGDESVVFEWEGFRVAPFVCYDLRFPELFRAAVAQGATLLAVIANWPSPRQHHWHTLLAARAIENQAIVLGVNRAGTDPAHTYSGGSQAFDPQGRSLAKAGEAESLINIHLKPQDVARWRAEFPAVRDAGLPG